ncbi:MAG: hypothetical protein M3340_17935 [Actinomycetota bacterium]|nr:hypothetical protein [Actinomycetota bacterium]
METIALTLAGGSWVMLGFMAFLFVAVVVGYYTALGSGITPRPYGKIYGGAPGAFGPSDLSGKDHREHVSWSRGTR